MKWNVEYTDQFEEWFVGLSEKEQDSVDKVIIMLEQLGPTLPFPYSSGINNSKYKHMRELRIQHKGKPYRVLYAFDPRRTAILLLGGNKTGSDKWYDTFIPKADKIYEEHLKTLKKKGLI